jgi:hypothetical protein
MACRFYHALDISVILLEAFHDAIAMRESSGADGFNGEALRELRRPFHDELDIMIHG